MSPSRLKFSGGAMKGTCLEIEDSSDSRNAKTSRGKWKVSFAEGNHRRRSPQFNKRESCIYNSVRDGGKL